MTKLFWLSLLFLIGLSVAVMDTTVVAQDLTAGENGNWRLVKVLDGLETPAGPFQEISAIDLDGEGNLFIVDAGRNRLLKYSMDGLLLKEIGGFGRLADGFNYPRDIDAHLTLNVYVADYNNNRVVRLDKNLNYLNEFTLSFENPFYFELPLSVAVNNQYDLFILEELNKQILKMDRFNQPVTAFGRISETVGQLIGPYQLAMGNKNEIFVSDPIKKSVMVFDQLGNFLREVTHPDFIEPKGIFITPRDELLVADFSGQKIYFYGAGGKYAASLNLQPLNFQPTDVASWYPRVNRPRILYVSSRDKCYVFTEMVPQ